MCLQDLQDLENQLEVLKDNTPTGTGGDDGSLDDRLEKLQQDAGLLANTTDNILKSLEGTMVHFLTLNTQVCAQVKGCRLLIQNRPTHHGCLDPF